MYPRTTDINIDQELITNNKINILDAPKIETSSDQIRKRIKEGDDIQSYLPKEIYKYIIEKKLYK